MSDPFKIITLEDNEKICENGFYRIPIKRHHSQPCDGISVTSGVLRTMEIASPADVWDFHQLNPNRWAREETDALLMGRAMASFVEGGINELSLNFHVLPDGHPSRPTSVQLAAIAQGKGTEAGKRSATFWAAMDRDPREILTNTQWDLIVAMGSVVRDDPAAQAALGGNPEITMAWYDELNDLWCLARPDQVSFSGMLSDYKKVSTQGAPFTSALCSKRTEAHRYDMQMAFAAEGFQQLTWEWPDEVGLVFQSDKAPHRVILQPIDDEDLIIGQFCNRRQRRKFRECLNSGHWPSPSDNVTSFRRSEVAKERLLLEMAKEGYGL